MKDKKVFGKHYKNGHRSKDASLSLSLRPVPYKYNEFIDHVKQWQARSGADLRIVCYVSDMSTEDLIHSMSPRAKIKTLGEVFEVVAKYFREDKELIATFYCYHDETRGILLAFTSEPSFAIDKTLNEWAKYQPHVYYLWVNPKLFVDIENKILNEHEDTIIPSFNAKRFPWNKFQNITRPAYERSFEYHGDDGRYALEELENYYGVLPTSIDFVVPRTANFRITNDGLFTFKSGNLEYVFGIINDILNKNLEERQAIKEAKFEFIPLPSSKKELKVLNVVPLSVRLSKPITFDDAERVIDALQNNGFEVYNIIKEAGSLHLTGTVFDKQKKSTVDMTGNSSKLTLTPRGDVEFDSFMKIYRALSDYVDVGTSIGPPA